MLARFPAKSSPIFAPSGVWIPKRSHQLNPNGSIFKFKPINPIRKRDLCLAAKASQSQYVYNLWSQICSINPVTLPRGNVSFAALLAIVFVIGILFDRIWSFRTDRIVAVVEGDVPRKESVEWVNMVVGKLWRVYKEGIENWVVGSVQRVVDELEKPCYIRGIVIDQFSLGEEAIAVRSVERRTSRRADDLQYQIGIRYTGDARMFLSLKLHCGIFPLTVPVGLHDFDIDGELWVKLHLISTEPWVGALSWAFVSLPKIKFALSPFHQFNLMDVPLLSMALRKLLMEDLPRFFVRPNKVVVDFLEGKSLDPISNDHESMRIIDGNRDYVGELSITLVDGRNLPYFSFARSDPYVVLTLEDQVFCSKKNRQTTVVGPPGEPVWNQDFHMRVKNPRTETLNIKVKDSIGFIEFTVGVAEISLGSLKDTVRMDKVVALRGCWTPFNKGFSGEILVRLTYKAYCEDDEDAKSESTDNNPSADECSSPEVIGHNMQGQRGFSSRRKKKSFMDILTALLASEEF